MTPDPAQQRAAEQAVVRAALQRGWLTTAAVGLARRAAQTTGQPLLQALRASLDAEQQQALAQVYREALAAAVAPPTSAALTGATWSGDMTAPPPHQAAPTVAGEAPADRTRAGDTTLGPAPAPDASLTRAPDVPAGAPGPADPRMTWMTHVGSPGAPPASAPGATWAGETRDPTADAARLAAAWGGKADQGPPPRIGPYEVERELARGGMGAVYVAWHAELDRRVALKLMLPGAGDDDAARFEREARVLGQLQHPNVVRLHDAGEEHGRRWMALELVAGGSLQGRLDREGPLEPRVAVALMEPVARAIAAAHAQGLLHRDLKPANVLLDDEGRPKVTDFGIAKPLDAHTRQLTRTGVAIGTASFAPPEQCGGGQEVDARADVYGLGATLFALLTGQPPFVGSYLEVVAQVIRKDPRPPSTITPGVPTELDRVVLRCLEKDPADRYASAGALADELARWLRGEPLEVQPPTVGRRLRRWRRRHPLAALGLLAGLPLLALAAVAAHVARDPGEPPPAATTRVEWTAPQDGLATQAASITARGLVSGPAEWVEVRVDGQPRGRRVLGGGEFELLVPLAPGDNDVSLRWRASTGEEGLVGPRRLRSSPVPAWFRELPEAERPPLPLPDGVEFSTTGRVYTNRSDGSELVWIPPGSFTMIAPGEKAEVDPARRPQDEPRPTTLTRGYFLGRFEVTFRQYAAFCRATGHEGPWRGIEYEVRDTPGVGLNDRLPLEVPFVAPDDHPAFWVSWDDARAYCVWAGLRLPTEAEWEWAARGPEARLRAWGDDTPLRGWVNGLLAGDGFPHTAPVGTFQRDCTPWGCFDMTGNVIEWTADRFGDVDSTPVTDPTGPTTGARRVARGAPWHHPAVGQLVTFRWSFEPDVRQENIGFRVAR